jgi:hypothetical protein
MRTLPDELKLFFGASENRNRIGEKMRELGFLKVDNPAQRNGRWKINGQNATIFVHRAIPENERSEVASAWRDRRNSQKQAVNSDFWSINGSNGQANGPRSKH